MAAALLSWEAAECALSVPCLPPAQLQASGKKKKELRYRSVISDIFDGSILSLVQCLTCDRVSALLRASLLSLLDLCWEVVPLFQTLWHAAGQPS